MKIKPRVYVINKFKSKILSITLTAIIIISILIIYHNKKQEEFTMEVSTFNTQHIKTMKSIDTNIIGKEEISNFRETLNLKEYENMPPKIEEYKVIGAIEIPKIGIKKYILEETNEKALKKSVTKICGPEINKTGNFCIAGHNYSNTFGKLNKLEKEDIIKLTDTYDRSVEYKVYDIQKVNPKDTECLTQDTKNEREITLVTCTLGAVKRIIVKAIEIYD